MKARLVLLARLMELAGGKGDADLIDFVDQMIQEEVNRQKKAARNPEARAGGEGEAKRGGERKPVGGKENGPANRNPLPSSTAAGNKDRTCQDGHPAG